jgi:hypothetical protein
MKFTTYLRVAVETMNDGVGLNFNTGVRSSMLRHISYVLDRLKRQARIAPPKIAAHRHENVICERVALSVHGGLHQAVGEVKHVGGVWQHVGGLALDRIAFEIESGRRAVAALRKRLGVS